MGMSPQNTWNWDAHMKMGSMAQLNTDWTKLFITVNLLSHDHCFAWQNIDRNNTDTLDLCPQKQRVMYRHVPTMIHFLIQIKDCKQTQHVQSLKHFLIQIKKTAYPTCPIINKNSFWFWEPWPWTDDPIMRREYPFIVQTICAYTVGGWYSVTRYWSQCKIAVTCSWTFDSNQ